MMKFQRADRVFVGAGSRNFRAILPPSLVVSRDRHGLACEMIKKKKGYQIKVYTATVPLY